MIFLYFSLFLYVCSIIENKLLFKVSALMVGGYFSITYAYGYDWLNYYQSYHALENGGEAFFADLAFILIMKLCIFFDLGYGGFNFIVNAFIYFFVYTFCKDLKNPTFAFFALFSFLGFFMFTEQIRQGLALSVILYGFSKYYFTSKKKFILTVFIATYFHFSAVLALSYFFIINDNKRGMMRAFLFSSLFYAVFITLLLSPNIVTFIQILQQKFEAYGAMYSDLDTDFLTFILHSKMLFVYLFFFLLFLFIKKPGAKKYTTYGSLYMLMLTRSSSLLVRVGYYFVPVFIYSIDDLMYSLNRGFKTHWVKLIICTVVLVVSTIPLWTPMYMNGSKSNLDIFSTTSDIRREIGKKCTVLRVNSDIRTDGCL
ncbi:EpsG family protein [Brenneria sp. 4F2]|nr:EpsG family protein [Brenneria bubanii]